MFAPAIAVGDRDDIRRVREAVPNLGEVAQEIRWLARARDKPYLLGNEHLDGNFTERKQRESLFFDVYGEMHPRQSDSLVPGALIFLAHALLHNALQHAL